MLFTYNNPPKNIYFAASTNYIIKKVTQKNIDIYTLLFKEHENLSYKLLQKAAYYIEMYDFEHSMEEDRYIAIGMVGDLLFVVFTERGENIRLISARLATEKERSLYYDNSNII